MPRNEWRLIRRKGVGVDLRGWKEERWDGTGRVSGWPGSNGNTGGEVREREKRDVFEPCKATKSEAERDNERILFVSNLINVHVHILFMVLFPSTQTIAYDTPRETETDSSGVASIGEVQDLGE